jgi:phosphoadenosine phosphosulfate reductase
MGKKEKLIQLNEQLKDKSIEESLKLLSDLFTGHIIFTTSFGIEDQVITHMIFSGNIPVRVITLDTGRLFRETYDVFAATIARYNKKIEVFSPDYRQLEPMVTRKGPFSFYESRENREECCRIRKMEPLNRALAGTECWVTGIRAGQSDKRREMSTLEYDEERDIIKYNPLFDWSQHDVEQYIKDNGIPYNVLHDRGYPSIGCEPCTRPVLKGQDIRSGRWWWENDGPKECGLHLRHAHESN